mgnify:CR=1 FL=1
MIVTAHQPSYLPWLGYFQKIMKSDIYVFLDSVQFEKNSFTNRNKIKTPQGSVWLTIPVLTKDHTKLTINEIQIDNRQDWKRKHLNAIFLNYKKAPRFEYCYSKLEVLYQSQSQLLSEICWEHLNFWLNELGINKKVVRSSQLPITSKKSELILDLCRYFGAHHYISGVLGRNYLTEDIFRQAGIHIEYQDYHHPIYPQLWGEFIPYMSIIDFWMNTSNASLIMGESHV